MYLEHEMYEIYRLIKNKGYGSNLVNSQEVF